MTGRAELERTLEAAGRQPDEAIDIAETALVLAALDRPRVDLDFYRRHLDQLAEEVGRLTAPGADAAAAAATLVEILVRAHGYEGDRLTYEDMQNANLMRVIDRRKGLPVALGILYMHAARRQGWRMVGLAFPSHFLVRLEVGGGRAILDPFERGRTLDSAALRQLLKAMQGEAAELDERHHAPVGNREVLLRLQNNIKSRALQANDAGRASELVRSMLLLAPAHGGLYRELAALEAWLGHLGAARAAAERAFALAADDDERASAALLLQRFRRTLN